MMKEKSRVTFVIILFSVICIIGSLGSIKFADTATGFEEPAFQVHYIDVGQANAALVICDGEAMLIDGGNRGDSDLIYTYLKDLSVDHLKYVVCTHGHEDHVGGLAGALHYATAESALCSVTAYDSKAFSNFLSCLDAHVR